ncbi:MAG: bifunctional DNA-formamidopyrimidine glycosylase/DNA-(apurinic or apyrimidinic site) lyase [Nitrospinaceae bacterium]
MPELPEVETLRRALLPIAQDHVLRDLHFLRPDLRFPIPVKTLRRELSGRKIHTITRQGKYLLLHAANGAMLWHLGMSGRVIQRPSLEPAEKHTHAVFRFEPDTHLHFVDPRRFGAILWVPMEGQHPLLDRLGPDPLAATTTGKILHQKARQCRGPIKTFLMNAARLAGVGNIYACEALFEAGFSPRRGAHRLSVKSWDRLLFALRRILENSIEAGGASLRDFFRTDGSPGYYRFKLAVYGRENKPCPKCVQKVRRIVQSGRSTFFCPGCQKK